MEIEKEKMIGQGNTAEIYRLEGNKILKLFRSGLHKEIVEREYQNGVSVQKILDCVPKVYDIIEIDGRYGIIYQEIIGTDMLKIMTSSLFKVNYYAKDLAHYHLEIHTPNTDHMDTVKEKLENDIIHVDALSDKDKEKVREYLKQLPDGNGLCHFDFHPGNVMIADGKAIYIDWMTACRGDVCADVARTCMMLKYGEVPHASWLMRKIISMFQHHIYRIYLKEYLKISGRRLEDINRWELPVAAARLREWISESEKIRLIQLVNEHCSKIN